MKNTEHVAPVGYINQACEHVLVSIYNPPLLNAADSRLGHDWNGVQVALSIEAAIELHAYLGEFLAAHKKRSFQ